MADLIPWSEFEPEYAKNFSAEMGAPAKSYPTLRGLRLRADFVNRVALGALIIKEKLGISDREIIEQVKKNPYLQYFLGLKTYSNECPFDCSMLVHFRTRINVELVKKINKILITKILEAEKTEQEEEKTEEKKLEKKEISPIKNQGKLVLDASCAPADISYPNDLGILNQARIQTQKIIDKLNKDKTDKGKKKPRTYRKKARKDYLKVAKKRRPKIKERRKALKKQLQYIKRNISQIDQLIEAGASLTILSKKEYKMLLVVREV